MAKILKNHLLKATLAISLATTSISAHSQEDAMSFLRPLVIPLAAKEISLDPRLVLDQSALWVNRQLNCQLVRLEGSEVVRDAAEKIEFKTPTRIEIKLKPGISFTDGFPVKAEDITATFDFLKQSRKVHRNIFQWVKQIKSLSEGHISIELTKPIPQFLKILSSPTQPIYSRAFLARAEKNPKEWEFPVSCGGYALQEKTVDEKGRTVFLLEPVREKLHPIRFVLTGTSSLQTDEVKKYDLIGLPLSGSSPSLIQGYQIVELFDPYQIYFAINTQHSSWSSQEKRCQLLESINPHSVITSYHGDAEPAVDWFPRGVIGYVPAQSETKTQTVSTFKQPFCLALLGVSIPEPLRPVYTSLFKNIFSNLQSPIIYNTKAFGKAFLDLQCDGIVFGLKSGYLDGFEYLQFLVEPDANVTGWSAPGFVKKLKETQDVADPTQRAKFYRKIVEQINDACLARPLLTLPKRRVYYRASLEAPNIGKQALDQYYLGLVR